MQQLCGTVRQKSEVTVGDLAWRTRHQPVFGGSLPGNGDDSNSRVGFGHVQSVPAGSRHCAFFLRRNAAPCAAALIVGTLPIPGSCVMSASLPHFSTIWGNRSLLAGTMEHGQSHCRSFGQSSSAHPHTHTSVDAPTALSVADCLARELDEHRESFFWGEPDGALIEDENGAAVIRSRERARWNSPPRARFSASKAAKIW